MATLRNKSTLFRTESLQMRTFSIFFLFFCCMLGANPAHAQDYFKLGLEAQNKADLDKAISYYNLKLKQDPNFVPAYIKRGLCYQDKADFDLALDDFKKADELKPGDAAIQMSMGTAYFHLKKYPEALQCLEYATQKEPGNTNAMYDLGMTRHELKNYAGAVQAFNNAIEMEPAKEKFYYSRGLSKDALKDYKGALLDFKTAVQLQPKYEKAYYMKAKEENEMRMYTDAMKDLDILIGMNPENSRYYAEKADIEYHLGWLAMSIEDSRKTIARNDQYGAPFYTKAMAERDSGLLDSALVDMNKANELFKGRSALAWAESAKLKIFMGNYAEAVNDAGRALQIAPRFNYALFYAGYALCHAGDPDKAMQAADMAIKNDSNFTPAWWLKGHILKYNKNDPKSAGLYFENGITAQSEPEYVAYCLAQTGHKDAALAELDQKKQEYQKAGQLNKLMFNNAAFAMVYAISQDENNAILYLGYILDEGFPDKSWIEDAEEFDFLRGSPLYKNLMEKYHLKK